MGTGLVSLSGFLFLFSRSVGVQFYNILQFSPVLTSVGNFRSFYGEGVKKAAYEQE